MGLIEKVTLEERPEEGDGASHADIWNKRIPKERRFSAKIPGWNGKLKKQPGGQWGRKRVRGNSKIKSVHNKAVDPEDTI